MKHTKILLLSTTAAFLSGCKTMKNVTDTERIVYVTDTIEVVQAEKVIVKELVTLKDSTSQRDSMAMTLDENGNSKVEYWHWFYRQQSESTELAALKMENMLLRQKKDSVRVEKEYIEKEVEKPPSAKQKIIELLFLPILLFNVILILFYQKRS